MLRRMALALWIAWAVLLWAVVFDHVIVVSGRNYIAAAERAYTHGSYENMDAWMRPAVTRAFWVATGAAAAIVVAGAVIVRFATRASG